MIVEADAAGFQLAVHAIGDRANSLVLDAFEKAARANGPRDRRFRIEHAQVVRKQDLPRYKALGVIASIQPSHCIDDMRWAEKRIGRERARDAYNFRSFTAAGIPVAFGTDWFVEPLDPRLGLYAAVTRELPAGGPSGGMVPGGEDHPRGGPRPVHARVRLRRVRGGREGNARARPPGRRRRVRPRPVRRRAARDPRPRPSTSRSSGAGSSSRGTAARGDAGARSARSAPSRTPRASVPRAVAARPRAHPHELRPRGAGRRGRPQRGAGVPGRRRDRLRGGGDAPPARPRGPRGRQEQAARAPRGRAQPRRPRPGGGPSRPPAPGARRGEDGGPAQAGVVGGRVRGRGRRLVPRRRAGGGGAVRAQGPRRGPRRRGGGGSRRRPEERAAGSAAGARRGRSPTTSSSPRKAPTIASGSAWSAGSRARSRARASATRRRKRSRTRRAAPWKPSVVAATGGEVA